MLESKINANFKEWIEHDYNPYILYTKEGAVSYLNHSAEVLLSYVDKRTFFDLAISYAPVSFGYKTSFVSLDFSKFNFFALTVGYESEEFIGIKLYQNPGEKSDKKENLNYELSNIYLLVELNITTTKTRCKAQFISEFDPTLPEFRLSQNRFSTLLRKVYEAFEHSNKITTSLKLKTGEYINIDSKKHQLIELSIKGDSLELDSMSSINSIASDIYVSAEKRGNNCIKIDIPMIM